MPHALLRLQRNIKPFKTESHSTVHRILNVGPESSTLRWRHLVSYDPVSYTHLDVYKRQVPDLLTAEIGDKILKPSQAGIELPNDM